MSRVVIFTEGSALWGLGHLHRCAAFEEEFASRNWSVEWRVCGDELARHFLASRVGRLESWWSPASLEQRPIGFQAAVIDSYHAPADAYAWIARSVPRCLYLDDDMRLVYPRGVVVNSAPHAAMLPYALGPGTTLLAGPTYHAMRSEFRRDYNRRIRPTVGRILVLMGGTDVRDLTPAVVAHVRRVYPGAEIRAIVPTVADRNDGARTGLTMLLGRQSASGMHALMRWADLAVSAAGQTLFELTRMGLPTIAIGVVENQRAALSAFSDAGVVVSSTWWDAPSFDDDLLRALERARPIGVRRELGRLGQALLDGLGAARCVAALLRHPSDVVDEPA